MGDESTDIINLEARAQVAAMVSGDLSPVEVMRATLSRIEAVNGAVNAIVSLADRESLMGAARLAEAMGPDGAGRALFGLPVAVKDLVAVKGMRSTWGSPLFSDHVPGADDGLVRALRRAGAIVIGKTNVPQFGLGSHSTNPVFGPTHNPFDTTLTAGGSSGGAAVALATGMVAFADGSDMMGSLRNPAAWNNVYGFRPSVGRVPGERRDHVLLHMLATNGPMARTVGDLALGLRVLSQGGFDGAPPQVPKRPRIAWLGDWGGAYGMAPELLGACEAALVRQAAALGWQVEAIAPPIACDTLWQSWCDLRSFAVAQDLGRHARHPESTALLNPQAQWEIARGFALTGDQVEQAAQARRNWLAVLDGLFARFDALMLPATQIWPFPVEWDWPRTIGPREMDSYHRWMEVVVPASLAGLPALAVPGGFGGPKGTSSPLPFGLQLIGAPGRDAEVLALGAVWEAVIGPREIHTPDPSSSQ